MRHWLIPVAIAALAGTASAQTDRLQVGAHVRLSAPSITEQRVVGHIAYRSADTLVIRSTGTAPAQYVVPITAIRVAEVGRRERLKPALIGAAIGGAIGLPLYDPILTNISVAGGSLTYSNEAAIGSCAAAAVLGATIGAFVGNERWDRLRVEPIVVSTEGRRRAALAVRVPF
jgi:hypothetical protein